MRRLRRCMAVALALAIGGSGSFSFANMSEAAEPVEMSETADLTVSAGIEDSEADESSLTAQAEQDSKSEAGETENGQKVSAGTESGDEEQQESQESPEGTEELDSSDISEDGSAAKPDDNTGTDSSRESAEQDSSSETEGEETPDQSSGSGTDVGDVSSGDNVDGSGSVPSSDPDSNAVMGGNAENPEQSGGAVSSEEESGQDSSSVPESHERAGTADNSMEEKAIGLEMPQEIRLTIDPWEIDGRGQVYSEQYVIKNRSANTIKLYLYDLACTPGEQSGVVVCADREDTHDSDSKAIYMEMVFGNGDRVTFTEEESEYTAELKPEEELVLWFAGEVNTDVSQDWNENDIKVTILYQWDDGQQGQAEGIDISEMEGLDGQVVSIGEEPVEETDINSTGGAVGESGESSDSAADGAAVGDGSMNPEDDSQTSDSGTVVEGSVLPESTGLPDNNGGKDTLASS